MGCTGAGAVHEADFVAEHFLEYRNEQWVVRAAEHKRVHAFGQQWIEVLFQHELQGAVICPTFFDKGDE